MTLWYDSEAYALLKECSDKGFSGDMYEWNKYRQDTNYAPISLRFLDLSTFNLSNADLRNIDFRGTSFGYKGFDESNIENSNFSQLFYFKIYFFVIVLTFVFTWLMPDSDSKKIIFNILWSMNIFYVIFSTISFIFGLKIFDKIPFLNILYIYLIIIFGSIIGFSLGRIETITPMVIGVAVIITILSILIFKFNIMYTDMQKRMAIAKNPEKAIGFDIKYLNKNTTSLSSHLDNEIQITKELLDKEKDEDEKELLKEKLKEIQDEKDIYLKNEAHAKTQQLKIQKTLKHILRPYHYIEQNISKLQKHNYFFYGIITILLSVFVYALLHNYLDTRSNQFLTVLNKQEVSFGTIFGVIIFYTTPILYWDVYYCLCNYTNK